MADYRQTQSPDALYMQPNPNGTGVLPQEGTWPPAPQRGYSPPTIIQPPSGVNMDAGNMGTFSRLTPDSSGTFQMMNPYPSQAAREFYQNPGQTVSPTNSLAGYIMSHPGIADFLAKASTTPNRSR